LDGRFLQYPHGISLFSFALNTCAFNSFIITINDSMPIYLTHIERKHSETRQFPSNFKPTVCCWPALRRGRLEGYAAIASQMRLQVPISSHFINLLINSDYHPDGASATTLYDQAVGASAPCS
jgi:hypothetical protein